MPAIDTVGRCGAHAGSVLHLPGIHTYMQSQIYSSHPAATHHTTLLIISSQGRGDTDWGNLIKLRYNGSSQLLKLNGIWSLHYNNSLHPNPPAWTLNTHDKRFKVPLCSGGPLLR